MWFFTPFAEDFPPPFNPEAVADIIAQHHIETGNDLLLHKLRERDKPTTGRGGEKIVNVAGEEELAGGVAVVEINDLLNRGEGDIIACNYTVTRERRSEINFSIPFPLTSA